MKKKKIYIAVRNSRASAYGIGTYQANLIDSLNRAGIEFGIIEFGSSVDEVSIERKNGFDKISIPPGMASDNEKRSDYFSRNTAYLLRELIPDDPEYDLIFHINFMTDATLVHYLKKLFKCKIVLTIHYTDWSFGLLGDTKKLDEILAKKRRSLDEKERAIRMGFEEDIKMAQKCDHVVYIADHSAETLSKYIKAKNRTIIHNGMQDVFQELSPEATGSARAKYLISPEIKVILFAGRLDEVKGVKYLIRAFREILPDHPNARLMIVGDGEFPTLLKEAEDVWSMVIFTGKVEKEKLHELYRIADIGVVSSIHEEFGYVAVEMIMHGLPVVVSDAGGLAEIIEEGVSGLKTPVVIKDGQCVLDTESLASKIGLLLVDGDLASKLGEGGRKRFLEKYELSVFGEKMISLYNRL